jgi:type I restriction enzyme, S subunit
MKEKIGKYLIQEKVRYDSVENKEDLPVYGVSNVEGITETQHRRSEDLSKYLVIRKGCFAYNPYRINVGSIGLTPVDKEGLVSPAYVVFRTNQNKLLPELLLDYLKSEEGLKEIRKYSRGTVRKALRFEDLCKIEMPIADIEKQRKMLRKKVVIDQKVWLLSSMTCYQEETLQNLHQQILYDAISGELSKKWRKENPDVESAELLLEKIKVEKEKLIKQGIYKRGRTILNSKTIKSQLISNNWKYSKLKDLFFVTKLAGFEYSKYIRLSDMGEIPVIRAQNVKPFVIDTSSVKYIDSSTSELLERSALTRNCLLVTFIGAGIGDVALFDKKQRWHLAPNVAKLEPYSQTYIDLEYINFYLLSDFGRLQIYKHRKATAQPSLSMGTIRDIDLIIPPIDEQKEIVRKIKDLFSRFDKFNELNLSNKERLELLNQILLKEMLYP